MTYVEISEITKFLTDSDGSLTVVKLDGTKLKLTNNGGEAIGANNGGDKNGAKEGPRRNGGFGKTLTNEELRSRFVD